ncbi:MAG: GNAT family N-acetyltransferase [Actinomycetota bacterium]|nr:GNAT family N-acetyltransferase [Actinomycetota bacterium]
MSGLELRAPRADEAVAVADVLTAAGETSGLGRVEPEEVTLWLSSPTYDIEGNFRVAVRDGKLVGYCDLVPEGEKDVYVWMDLRVPPGDAEVEPALVDWALARVAELSEGHAGRVAIRTGGYGNDPARAPLLHDRGFAVVRHSFRMLLDFEGEPENPVWPEGIELEPFERGRNDREAFDAFQEAFRDAWGFVPYPFEEWEHDQLEAHDFDPSLNFVARDGGDLAGVAFCRAKSATHPGYGWVDILGVRRPWRKRGLGEALLRHAFRELHARGLKGVGLGVDAESLTGATRLYERVGMRVVSRGDTYELEVRSG